MTTPTAALAIPLPPDLLAKAVDAILLQQGFSQSQISLWREQGDRPFLAQAEREAEAALRAVDVPGLRAEIAQIDCAAMDYDAGNAIDKASEYVEDAEKRLMGGGA